MANAYLGARPDFQSKPSAKVLDETVRVVRAEIRRRNNGKFASKSKGDNSCSELKRKQEVPDGELGASIPKKKKLPCTNNAVVELKSRPIEAPIVRTGTVEEHSSRASNNGGVFHQFPVFHGPLLPYGVTVDPTGMWVSNVRVRGLLATMRQAVSGSTSEYTRPGRLSRFPKETTFSL